MATLGNRTYNQTMADEYRKPLQNSDRLRKFIADVELTTTRQEEASWTMLGGAVGVCVTLMLGLTVGWSPPGVLPLHAGGIVGLVLGFAIYKLVTIKRKSNVPPP